MCVISSLLGKPPIHHFFALLTIDSINKFARNTTNNTSISLKIIPGASSGLWLSITMHYTPLRYPDPESLPTKLTDLLGFPPHDGQVEAIQSLTVNQEDLISLLLQDGVKARYSKQFQHCEVAFAL